MLAASPLARGAVTGRKYSEAAFGADTDLTAYMAELRMAAQAVKQGDMHGLELMLMTQASTLDMIFNHLARKATYSEYLNQFQTYLALALKAQAQSRATVEALAELKHPRPVAFVKQANIANGPQQVNNQADSVGAQPDAHARAEKSANTANELLTDHHGTTLDGGGTGETGRCDTTLETVGKLNGAAN